jgi:hypothetical protein
MTRTELWHVPTGGHFLDRDGEAAVVLRHGQAVTVDGDEIRTAVVRTEKGAEFVLRGDLMVFTGALH